VGGWVGGCVRGIGSQWESAARSAKVGLNGTMFRTLEALEVQCVYLLFCHNPPEDVN